MLTTWVLLLFLAMLVRSTAGGRLSFRIGEDYTNKHNTRVLNLADLWNPRWVAMAKSTWGFLPASFGLGEESLVRSE